MKKVSYEYEKMLQVVRLLNKINIQGIEQARIISSIANILDCCEVFDAEEKEDSENGLEAEKVCKD